MSSEFRPEDSRENASVATTHVERPAEVRSVPAKMTHVIRRVFFYCTFGLGILVIVITIGEVCARVVLYQLPDETFKVFASVRQYEKKPGLKFQFNFQAGFGLYPTPGWSDGNDRVNSRGFRG